jgi:hypothetical protein
MPLVSRIQAAFSGEPLPRSLRSSPDAWSSQPHRLVLSFGDVVTCGHEDRSVVADLESCYSNDRVCMGCACDVLRLSFPGAMRPPFADLVTLRFDKVCCHLIFGLADGQFRCECRCGHAQRSNPEGAAVVDDRLICSGCVGTHMSSVGPVDQA